MRSLVRHVFAAQAATRHVPLKRQGGVSSLTRAEQRVYPRACDAASVTRVTKGEGTLVKTHRFRPRGISSSMNHVFAAQAAPRRVPLKRQGDVSLLTGAEPRVYPRTCDAASGTRVTKGEGMLVKMHRFRPRGTSSSMNHVSAAQAATRHVPLKRQGDVSLLTAAEPRVHPRTARRGPPAISGPATTSASPPAALARNAGAAP